MTSPEVTWLTGNDHDSAQGLASGTRVLNHWPASTETLVKYP